MILLSKCRQSLGRPLLVYSMHLLEMRLRSSSALLPCCEVMSRQIFTWDSYSLAIADELRIVQTSVSTNPLLTFLKYRRGNPIDARFHPIQHPPCPGLLFYSRLASFPFQRRPADIPPAGIKRQESFFRVTAAQA